MRCAMTKDRTLVRFALLSGACYPLRSNEALRDCLLGDEREHINAFPMPDERRDKPLTRLTAMAHGERPARHGGSGRARHASSTTRCASCRPDAWPVSCPTPAAAGSSSRAKPSRRSWSASRPTGASCLLPIHALPGRKLFPNRPCNSALREHIAGSLTFADWSSGIEQPSQIREDHLPRLLDGSESFFFARKFSSDNAHLLDRIDAARGVPTAAPGRRVPEPLMGLTPGYAASP